MERSREGRGEKEREDEGGKIEFRRKFQRVSGLRGKVERTVGESERGDVEESPGALRVSSREKYWKFSNF